MPEVTTLKMIVFSFFIKIALLCLEIVARELKGLLLVYLKFEMETRIGDTFVTRVFLI